MVSELDLELRCPGVLTSGATSAQTWKTHFSACCALADYLKEHRLFTRTIFMCRLLSLWLCTLGLFGCTLDCPQEHSRA